ncbi:M56 family metallopeptidase [Flavobacterium sp. H4147]|uniref:M56 family metallopeptidase n=1 Tax=Flavobacterium sp. H4147 TaxID=3034149 RepID=UPI0023EBDEFC|nr:M56 family metallopeptidase [Flavobacterium sp. H4147]
MITYLFKSGLLLIVFFAVYKLLLENERMFRFNRAYLLASLVFSFVIPLQLFSFKTSFETGINAFQLEGVVIKTSRVPLNETYILKAVLDNLIPLYVVVSIVLAFHFILNLVSFFRKLRNKETRFVSGVKVILTDELVLPHSFWNAVFVNKTDFEMEKIPAELLVHEKTHLEQRHTLDILFLEILKIIFWINPFIYLFKKTIKLNHEFLADEAVNKQFGEVKNYQNLLLDFISQKNTIALASNINYLITKKRLLMMTKKESQIKNVLKICVVSAVCTFVLFTFSAKSIAQSNDNTKVQKDFKVSYDTTSVNEPQYPGGMTEFYKFIGKNFKIPAEVSKNKIATKIKMQFMVEKDGSLSEIEVVKDAYDLGEEAIRVLKLSPKWIPGSENGKPVRVMYSLPITIQSEK